MTGDSADADHRSIHLRRFSAELKPQQQIPGAGIIYPKKNPLPCPSTILPEDCDGNCLSG